MRVVRDFIDRVTARALGSESMLSPRLPSFFEPERTSPVGLTEEASTTVAPTLDRAMTAEHATTTPRVASVSPAKTTARTAATVHPATTSEPRSTVRRGVDDEHTLVTSIVRSKGSAPEEPRLPPPRHAPAPPERPIPPAPVQRERLLEVLSATEGHRVPDEGSLLVPAQSVFRTPLAPTSTAGERFRATHGGQATQPAASREPVVHVTIGRLEVRATPTPGKVAQRPDTPRPSPLDDYLRQRGKASP